MWGKTIRLQGNSSADPGQQLSLSCNKQREKKNIEQQTHDLTKLGLHTDQFIQHKVG